MSELKIYCVTDKIVNLLIKITIIYVGLVNQRDQKGCDLKENIFYKENFIQSSHFIIGIGKTFIKRKRG